MNNITEDVNASVYPTIILKKGSKEIKIQNAAAIIKKLDELHPTNDYLNWNKHCRDISNREKDKQIRWTEASKNWFKQEIFGSLDDFEVVVETQKPKDEVVQQPAVISEAQQEPKYKEPEIVKPSNKNAYEIRADILSQALSWVQYKHNVAPQIKSPTDDDVLDVAQKFYKFVENKR